MNVELGNFMLTVLKVINEDIDFQKARLITIDGEKQLKHQFEHDKPINWRIEGMKSLRKKVKKIYDKRIVGCPNCGKLINLDVNDALDESEEKK